MSSEPLSALERLRAIQRLREMVGRGPSWADAEQFAREADALRLALTKGIKKLRIISDGALVADALRFERERDAERALGEWERKQRYETADRADRYRERMDELQARVRDLEHLIEDDRSLTAWRAAHEVLNAAGIEGEPGLVARIGALAEDRDFYRDKGGQ